MPRYLIKVYQAMRGDIIMLKKIEDIILQNLHIEHNGFSGLRKTAKKIKALFEPKKIKKHKHEWTIYEAVNILDTHTIHYQCDICGKNKYKKYKVSSRY